MYLMNTTICYVSFVFKILLISIHNDCSWKSSFYSASRRKIALEFLCHVFGSVLFDLINDDLKKFIPLSLKPLVLSTNH